MSHSIPIQELVEIEQLARPNRPVSYAQACVVRDLWHGGWNCLEIAPYLGVSPARLNTAQADQMEDGQ